MPAPEAVRSRQDADRSCRRGLHPRAEGERPSFCSERDEQSTSRAVRRHPERGERGV